VCGRVSHSSTSQPKLSHLWSLMPQLSSTSQLNLRCFFVDESLQIAHEKSSRQAEKRSRVVQVKGLC
jgi:hypothetical protein